MKGSADMVAKTTQDMKRIGTETGRIHGAMTRRGMIAMTETGHRSIIANVRVPENAGIIADLVLPKLRALHVHLPLHLSLSPRHP